jgi:hypothetical protein
MIFYILTQDMDPPFKMWNLIIKLIICLYTSEFVQMIKLPLNNLSLLEDSRKITSLERMNFLFVSLYDLGDQILLKIQSSWNRFKSNGSVGLIVTNPTQLVLVQTDIGSERYHVLFKTTNR